MNEEMRYVPEIPEPLLCPRCNKEMLFAGTKKFHEGSFEWGFWLGNLGELFTNRERFDVYVCPECGRVEFFLEGLGEESRPPKPGAPVV